MDVKLDIVGQVVVRTGERNMGGPVVLGGSAKILRTPDGFTITGHFADGNWTNVGGSWGSVVTDGKKVTINGRRYPTAENVVTVYLPPGATIAESSSSTIIDQRDQSWVGAPNAGFAVRFVCRVLFIATLVAATFLTTFWVLEHFSVH